MGFGLIVIGDEILSGRREDKHMRRAIELMGARGIALDWAEYIGDDRVRITATLRRTLATSDVVFCTGAYGRRAWRQRLAYRWRCIRRRAN